MKAIALLTLFVGFTAADPRTSELATTPSVAAGSDSHSVITEYRLPPNKLEKAKSLYRTQVTMFVVTTIYGLAVIIFVLATRLAPRLRDSESASLCSGDYLRAAVAADIGWAQPPGQHLWTIPATEHVQCLCDRHRRQQACRRVGQTRRVI